MPAARRVERRAPPLVAGLRTFLGGWLGIGRIVVGMARQRYDLQLTRYGEEGWRATFYPAGRGHSVTSAVGSAWEREPWMAVQRAAWESPQRYKGGRGGVMSVVTQHSWRNSGGKFGTTTKRAVAILGNCATFHASSLA